MNEEKPTKKKTSPGNRWRFVMGMIVIFIGLLLMGPWFIANTGLRDRILSSLIDDPTIKVSSRSASFGYFSPLSIDELQIDVNSGESSIDFKRIEAEKSWLSMLFEKPELGQFTFVEPVVDVTVAASGAEEASDSKPSGSTKENSPNALPQLSAVIKDAKIIVHHEDQKDPVIDLEQVNVTFHLERDGDASVLAVDPIVVFDHRELTPELCNDGLQLVAPLMAEHVAAEGSISFQLETFRIPVGTNEDTSEKIDRVEIAGEVTLHNATIGMKDSVTMRLVQLAANLLETEIPKQISVVEETSVQFHVKESTVYHEGFAMVLPHGDSFIEVRSSGFVGLDQSLDLQVELLLPENALGDTELAVMLSSTPIRLHVGGTIETPTVELAAEGDWIDQVQQLIGAAQADGSTSELIGRTIDLLGVVLQNRPEREERLLPNLRDRIRERRERRRDQ